MKKLLFVLMLAFMCSCTNSVKSPETSTEDTITVVTDSVPAIDTISITVDSIQ